MTWTTRAIGDVPHADRYRSAKPEQEVFSKKEVLFGADHCRHAVVVVEGHFDVFRGGPGFAATGGTGYSPQQLARIAAFPVRAVCFDADEGGRRAADELAGQLAPLPGETYLISISGKDLDTTPADEIAAIRRQFLE